MILKQIRIGRHLSQEQLAQMSGLNVRTIQRIESGHNASLESLKCLASVLEVDVSTLNQERFMKDKDSGSWQDLPLWLSSGSRCCAPYFGLWWRPAGRGRVSRA